MITAGLGACSPLAAPGTEKGAMGTLVQHPFYIV
jgi:hypothetical protein